MTKWANENRGLFALAALLCAALAFVFLSKSEAASTYALKTDITRIEEKIDRFDLKVDRLLIACGEDCKK